MRKPGNFISCDGALYILRGYYYFASGKEEEHVVMVRGGAYSRSPSPMINCDNVVPRCKEQRFRLRWRM